ncbi:MAG TPA: glutathione S-transferase family protein [Sulfuricella sp.]|nr:glutathione S-transferase family protein [Sulfuricella sp.]
MDLNLIIGNKNYSSWSLRPWFYLKYHGIPFNEIKIPLYREDSKQRILSYSHAGKVPVLIDGEDHIWDSLAILEYLAELYPETHGWPNKIKERSLARSLSAEMHSGFQALRMNCGMNCRRPIKSKELSEEVFNDIARIRQIWQECRTRFGGEGSWLLGRFSILDAMYAPVALRFHTYQLAAGEVEQDYVNTVLTHPAIQEWIEAGKQETEVIQAFED